MTFVLMDNFCPCFLGIGTFVSRTGVYVGDWNQGRLLLIEEIFNYDILIKQNLMAIFMAYYFTMVF